MPPTARERVHTSVRLTAEGHDVLLGLAHDLGLSKAAVFELALRTLRKVHDAPIQTGPGPQTVDFTPGDSVVDRLGL
jgi:hypothetical protein